MARRIKERTFDPKKELVVRRAFTANGRKYMPGQPFDWEKKAIPVRRVATLFSANMIDHLDKKAVENKVVNNDDKSATMDDKPSTTNDKTKKTKLEPVKKVTK